MSEPIFCAKCCRRFENEADYAGHACEPGPGEPFVRCNCCKNEWMRGEAPDHHPMCGFGEKMQAALAAHEALVRAEYGDKPEAGCCGAPPAVEEATSNEQRAMSGMSDETAPGGNSEGEHEARSAESPSAIGAQPLGSGAASPPRLCAASVSPCTAAAEIVRGDRQAQYGHPADHFSAVANLWWCYVAARRRMHQGAPETFRIEARDVPAMMMLFKIARMAGPGKNPDNLTDIAGYAEAAWLAGEKISNEQ